MLVAGHNLVKISVQKEHLEEGHHWSELVVKDPWAVGRDANRTIRGPVPDPQYTPTWLALRGFPEAIPWQGLGTPTTCNLSFSKLIFCLDELQYVLFPSGKMGWSRVVSTTAVHSGLASIPLILSELFIQLKFPPDSSKILQPSPCGDKTMQSWHWCGPFKNHK